MVRKDIAAQLTGIAFLYFPMSSQLCSFNSASPFSFFIYLDILPTTTRVTNIMRIVPMRNNRLVLSYKFDHCIKYSFYFLKHYHWYHRSKRDLHIFHNFSRPFLLPYKDDINKSTTLLIKTLRIEKVHNLGKSPIYIFALLIDSK